MESDTISSDYFYSHPVDSSTHSLSSDCGQDHENYLISNKQTSFCASISVNHKFNYSNQLNNQLNYHSTQLNYQPHQTTLKMSASTQRNATNLPQYPNQHRSQLKQPTVLITVQSNSHSMGHGNENQSNHQSSDSNSISTNMHSLSNSSNHTVCSSATNSFTNRIIAPNLRREIPRLPNAMQISKLQSSNPPSQPTSPMSCTISNISSIYSNQTSIQKNSLQTPPFDKSAISGLKLNHSSKIQRPQSDNSFSTIGHSSGSRSSSVMPTNVASIATSSAKNNHPMKSQSVLGSTSNLSSIKSSNSFRSSLRSNQHRENSDQTQNKAHQSRSFGLQSKYGSLSKSNLNSSSSSTNNLDRSNLNLNTLSSIAKQPTTCDNNLKSSSLSTSSTHLNDTLNNKRSLIKPRNSLASASCLPAPKSRPTSAYLPDSISGTLKSKSKLPNSNNAKTSSNLNLNENLRSPEKPVSCTIKTSPITSSSINLKGLNKKPQTSNSIKTTMQNLSQSSSSSMVYKPYTSLTNKSKVAKVTTSGIKETKADDQVQSENSVIEDKRIDDKLLNEKITTKRSVSSQNVKTSALSEKCHNNVARVSPIRRQCTMTKNVKRQLNGSLNSSDQEEEDELDDDLFDTNSTLNQPTSDDTNSFNSEDAKYYAALSSSEDDKLSHQSRHSREREEGRLRRVSGQRGSSSKRSSSAAASTTSLPAKKNAQTIKSNCDKLNQSNNKNYDSSKNTSNNSAHFKPCTVPSRSNMKITSQQDDLKKQKTSSRTNLNKSNSSSVNTIDYQPTSLNTMFPTLNRLHNSNSIQQLNSLTQASVGSETITRSENSGDTSKVTDEQDYQSDDAEITLFKLKSLDFNCNSSIANNKESDSTKKDGNNNSLTYKDTIVSNEMQATPNEQLPNMANNSFMTTPGLSSLLNSYMSRSIGSLTGSLNGLNNNATTGPSSSFQFNNGNWPTTHKTCSTPPPSLLSNLRSKSPSIYQNSFLNSATPSLPSHIPSFLPSSIPSQQGNNSSGIVSNNMMNNVQNTKLPNNMPSSFSARLNKNSENRGSSLSLISGCSSNYSNNLSITLNPPAPASSLDSPQSDQRLIIDKTTLNEIKYLKNELNRANEKINLLKSQLVTSGQMVNSFEQSLQSKTSRMKSYVLQLEEKEQEIDYLKMIIENLKKTYGLTSLDFEYRSSSSSPVPPNLHKSRYQANNSDGESVLSSNDKNFNHIKGKAMAKGEMKRNDSKKSRASSLNAQSTDDEETASLASVHSKEGISGASTGWFKSSFQRAFKKKRDRSKHGSNQELDKVTLNELNVSKHHPQHPSQLHHSYVQQQDKFKDNELSELKAQLIEKEKSLTDERLRSLSREEELLKLKECINCLQQEMFSLKKQTA